MSLLEMKHIKKEFSGVSVIRDISFSVEQGEILAIIGPSGSGKSTLLRCATMLETIENGEILYMGKKAVWTENGKLFLAKKQQRREIESCFGLVFQNFNLFPHFSVIKNITDAPIRVQKREKETVYREAEILLKKMGLADKADAYPHQLSGGQQQRVSIARALAKNPKLLLCDEPTGALDYNTGKQILKLLQDTCREKGMTVIVITHNSALAPMADRIIHIKNGKVSSMEQNEGPTPVEEIEW